MHNSFFSRARSFCVNRSTIPTTTLSIKNLTLTSTYSNLLLTVNTPQYFLIITLVCCQQPEDASSISGRPQKGFSLVVVEGGPKGIKKFVRLMLKRVDWETKVEAYATPYSATAGQEEGETETSEQTIQPSNSYSPSINLYSIDASSILKD